MGLNIPALVARMSAADDTQVVGGQWSTACYITDSFPSGAREGFCICPSFALFLSSPSALQCCTSPTSTLTTLRAQWSPTQMLAARTAIGVRRSAP